MTPENRCGAKTRNGTPCPNWPLKGGKRCRQHGGASPQALAAASQRVLEAKVRGEATKRGWNPITDPLAAFADIAGQAWAWMEICRELVNELQTWEAKNYQGTEEIRARIGVYERSMDRMIKVLADMIKLGLDAAALQQAKERPSREQAETFNQILTHILNGLDLNPTQRSQVPVLMGQALTREGLIP